MDQQLFQEGLQQLRSIAEGLNNPWIIWVPLSGVVVALLLGILGIFQDWIRVWFKKPNLKASIALEPPDCLKIPLTENHRKICDTYYCRFRVENGGNYYAENVEAMVTEVYMKKGDQYERLANFLPLNLVWANSRQLITMPIIQPKLFKHLDFGHILESKIIRGYLESFGINSSASIFFELDVAVKPNTGSHILLPGDYKVNIIFAGSNIKPRQKTYHLILNDRWDNNEQKMLKENVFIKEI
ncbi:MAG: hypothetical protein WBD99_02550 [Thermodesulfobacteriota bacterium]